MTMPPIIVVAIINLYLKKILILFFDDVDLAGQDNNAKIIQ